MDRSQQARRPSRRRVLGLVGASTAAAVAGCTSSLPGSDDATAGPTCPDASIGVETVHCVAPVESDRSAEEYYGHDTENTYSSAMPDGIERSDATVTFVHRNGATGELAVRRRKRPGKPRRTRDLHRRHRGRLGSTVRDRRRVAVRGVSDSVNARVAAGATDGS